LAPYGRYQSRNVQRADGDVNDIHFVELFSSSKWSMQLLVRKPYSEISHGANNFVYVKITLNIHMQWKVRNLEKWSFKMIFVWLRKMLAHKIGELGSTRLWMST
jgi:hypothetical protein